MVSVLDRRVCPGSEQGRLLFLYNIPKWNIRLGNFLLERGMHFRDWIVVDMKFGLPIQGGSIQATTACFTSAKGSTGRFTRFESRLGRAATVGKTSRTMGATGEP